MSRFSRWRRSAAALGAVAVTGAGLTALTAAPAQAAEENITDATFTWGINGYAQQGVFAAWEFKDLEGNVTKLNGGEQQEYLVDPVPATSFPANARAGSTPNAVKFTEGEGTIDRESGAASLSWDGSYTVNAYPAGFNAPDEIYTDPQLEIDADGSGTLTVDFTLGGGVDMEGNPVDEENFGRITLLTFDDGSVSDLSETGYRVTPDYQGVVNGIAGQATDCTADGGSTGWWGSWPTEFIDAIADTAVVAHFYSTGCGGAQDTKPPLPFDIGYGASVQEPQVSASATSFSVKGQHDVTVTGQGFTTTGNLGTRPPLAGKPAGVYVGFAYLADPTKPTHDEIAGAARSAKWVLPGESYDQLASNPAAVKMNDDGSFSATVTAAFDNSKSGQPAVFVFPGGGSTNPDEEFGIPITFTAAFPDVPTDHQFFGEIAWLVNEGITTGYANGTFNPDGHIERQAMAAFLYRMLNPEDDWTPPATSPFKDVPTNHQFYKEITWLADTKITTGYADGTFRPRSSVERKAMAAFLYRAAERPTWPNPSAKRFSDVPTNHQFAKEIDWLAAKKITGGYANGTFRPDGSVERKAMAAFLYRFDGLPQD